MLTEADKNQQQNELSDLQESESIALILQQAGKSADEVAALATLDDADRSAEDQFSGEAPTIASLFGTGKAREFHAGTFSPSPEVAKRMANCLDFLMERKNSGTLLDNERMLFQQDVITGLADLGFFGLAIPEQYGGSGAKLGDLGPLLRALTFIHPDLAVMFEVHNFLGPVTPILDFGTEEQKEYFLPKMARGELLGSFALTEPGVGADPSRLSMTATLDGDHYRVSGVKWPITNVIYGGVCVLVVKLEGHDLKPGRDSGMIILEVPKTDTETFRMRRNDLTAFDYLWNARFRLMDHAIPKSSLLGPPGRGLAQAFSSLAKGRGGIGVNSAAKVFKLLAHVILDPEVQKANSEAPVCDNKDGEPNGGGWTSFRSTFGKPIGSSPRIQTWVGRATAHGLASRVLGDLCFRLAANGVRDETQGMIAKVYATKALLQTAINAYQIQGGRSVHTDESRKFTRMGLTGSTDQKSPTGHMAGMPQNPIENYIGENMHEFTIATVYEGPNPVLSDVGAPNAMTRGIRSKYLEPIGLAELNGSFGFGPKAKFGWYVAKTYLGSFFSSGDLSGVSNLFPEKARLIRNAFKRNRKLGRQILMIIAKYQKAFMDESFLLGDEGGVFDQLCHSLASLCFVLSLDKPSKEYLMVANALDLEAGLRMKGFETTPKLQRAWAEIGKLMMDKNSQLHRDLLGDMKVADIPLDPRFIDRFI